MWAGDARVARVARVVGDLTGTSLAATRIVDLACDEGNFAIELAAMGAAEVVGIEGRAEKLVAANAAREARALTNLRFEAGDVRDVTLDSHGTFDVVLCLGILYHFDTPDVFSFARNLAGITTRYAIIETQVSLSKRRRAADGGHEYWGRSYPEDISMSGASLDNPESFWPTRASLLNLLQDVGFTTVAEVQVPIVPEVNVFRDHVMLLAAKGRPQEFDPPQPARWPERLPATAHPTQGLRWRLLERLRRARGGGMSTFFQRPPG
jgi:SAM-dependent methyltransferase